MNDNFLKAFNHMQMTEGGYNWYEKDTGEETIQGISRANNPNWNGWSLIDKYKKEIANNISSFVWRVPEGKELTDIQKQYWELINKRVKGNKEFQNSVKELYYEKYYSPWIKYNLPIAHTAKLFDISVNNGIGSARIILQKALGFNGKDVDGIIGRNTLESLNEQIKNPDEFMDKLCESHKQFYLNWFKTPKGAKWIKQKDAFLKRAKWRGI